jgi:L-histidine Nalpha-methyltransferase
MLPATENPCTSTPLLVPRFIDHHLDAPANNLHAAIYKGLSQPVATIAPKYFYDALGSRLFDAITALEEYYPTRTEEAIMRTHAHDIAQAVGTGRCLVDLGAGNCEKAARLFASLKPSRYIAVDISADHLRHALASLQRVEPDMEMIGIGMDFSTQLSMPAELGKDVRNTFYPGSSIGNFTPDEALSFLKQVHAMSLGGGLIIGVDMVKPTVVLEAAYDDALGVTAAFNLNALSHLNRIAATDFKLKEWKHVALFNEAHSRIEMHLQARHALKVSWPQGVREFVQDERIHTENSYKYRPADFEMLLAMAGFKNIVRFTDEKGWFSVFTAAA